MIKLILVVALTKIGQKVKEERDEVVKFSSASYITIDHRLKGIAIYDKCVKHGESKNGNSENIRLFNIYTLFDKFFYSSK